MCENPCKEPEKPCLTCDLRKMEEGEAVCRRNIYEICKYYQQWKREYERWKREQEPKPMAHENRIALKEKVIQSMGQGSIDRDALQKLIDEGDEEAISLGKEIGLI